MLVGKDLLAKVKELGDVSKRDLVRGCGYVSTNKDGEERLNFTAFYEALLEAKKDDIGLQSPNKLGEPFTTKDGRKIEAGAKEYSQLANQQYLGGAYKLAIDSSTKALEIDPEYFDALTIRGDSNYNLGNDKEAIYDYTKAIEINPQLWDSYHKRGVSKYNLGDYKGAINDYKKLLEINQEDLIIYVTIGNLLDDLGHYEEAIPFYGKAIELDSEFFPAYYHRGYAKSVHGDYQGAIVDFNKTLELDPYEDPEESDVYKERGKAKKELGDLKGAFEDWKKAEELGDLDAADLLKDHCKINEGALRIKLRNTAIALGVGAATAAGLSLLKVDKPVAIGSTAVVVGAGLIIALKERKELNPSEELLVGEELLEKEKLSDLPFSRDALWVSIEIITRKFRYQDSPMTFATYKSICNIEDYFNPEITDLLEDSDEEYWRMIIDNKDELTEIDSLKEWVKCRLDDDDELDALKQFWKIDDCDPSAYDDKEDFLSAVDWDNVVKVVKEAWDYCRSEKAIEQIIERKEQLDSMED